MHTPAARLLISCPDRPGIIAAVTGLVRDVGGNVVDADQHADAGRFFMRLEIERATESAALAFDADDPSSPWSGLARTYDMDWRLRDARPKRVAVFAGPSTHCVADLLWRVRTGELDAEITAVISNHDDARAFAEPLGCPFHLIETPTKDTAGAEQAALDILAQTDTELVVLARYMRVLSPAFVSAYPRRIINIHHSFLPAFSGARPYHQAFERGVKLIGATSHYVTDVLDDGPIIAQQTAHVSHRDTVDDLVRKGRDLERVVLAEAVRAHLDDRIIVHGRKTVVF